MWFSPHGFRCRRPTPRREVHHHLCVIPVRCHATGWCARWRQSKREQNLFSIDMNLSLSPPPLKKVSFFLFLLLNFWAFSIYLVYIFDALTENLILGGSPKSMACDVTNSSEANPIFSIQQCDVETLMHIHRKWTLQTFFVQQSNLWTEKYIQNLWYNLYFLMREKEKAPF